MEQLNPICKSLMNATLLKKYHHGGTKNMKCERVHNIFLCG